MYFNFKNFDQKTILLAIDLADLIYRSQTDIGAFNLNESLEKKQR